MTSSRFLASFSVATASPKMSDWRSILLRSSARQVPLRFS